MISSYHNCLFFFGEYGTRTHDLLTASQKYYVLVFTDLFASTLIIKCLG